MDDVIGGVLGFGTRHECRDWNQLIAWTAKWEQHAQGCMERHVDVQMHIQSSIVNGHNRDQSNGLIPCMRLSSNILQAVS